MTENSGNPYVGLRPFETEESLLFFGRNEQTSELLLRLHQNHFVAVVGSSGSGKSSILKAGLIPALKAGYLVEDSDHWMIADMKPGQSPLANLAASILFEINPTAKPEDLDLLLENMRDEGAEAILKLLLPIWKTQNINFFLLVDQFEEFFRFANEREAIEDQDLAIDFINIMLELSQQRQLPFYVVITMRSDFIGECSQFNGLPEAMNQSQYLVPRLNRVQMKKAIEGPAKLFGGKIDHTLTSLLLNKVSQIKDELPLLQHVLMRIWDHHKSHANHDRLDVDDYKKVGGLEKALAIHADEAMKNMGDNEIQITKRIFQALTTVDENSRKIRRPKLLSSLQLITGASKETILSITQKFNDDKRNFLVISKIADSEDILIDISHESLMRVWERLGKWVDEETESAKIYLRIGENAILHKQGMAGLWRDPDLQIAQDWRTGNQPNIHWAVQYNDQYDLAIKFIEDSILDKHKSLAEKKRRILTTRIFALTFLVIVSGLAVWAWVERGKSNENEAKALSEAARAENLLVVMKAKNDSLINEKERTKTAEEEASQSLEFAKAKGQESEINLKKSVISDNARKKTSMVNLAKSLALKSAEIKSDANNNTVKALLALQAYHFYLANDGKPGSSDIFSGLFSAWRSLQDESQFVDMHSDKVNSVVFSPDNSSVAAADDEGSLIVRNTMYMQKGPRSFPQQDAELRQICYNSDGTLIAAIKGNNKVVKYGAGKASQKPIVVDFPGKASYNAIVWYGNQLLAACGDGKLYKLDMTSNSVKTLVTQTALSCLSVCNQAGILIAGNNKGQLFTIDLKGFSEAKAISSPTSEAITAVDISRDGSRAVIGTDEGNIWVLTIQGKNSQKLSPHQSKVTGVVINSQGNLLATSSLDKTIKLWDMASPDIPVYVFREHTGWVTGIDFSANGNRLVSGSKDKSVRTYLVNEGLLEKEMRSQVKRNLTKAEWDTYVGKDVPYEKTVPGL